MMADSQDRIASFATAKRPALDAWLAVWAGGDKVRGEARAAILAIAAAGDAIAHRIARGPLGGGLGVTVGANSDGDAQKALDIWANDCLVAALRDAGVRAVASEELAQPLDLGSGGSISVAIDPLDGSSNIDTNVAIGTIFSLLPARTGGAGDFLQPGSAQIAAGYILYGPHVALMLTVGDGTQAFALDPGTGAFALVDEDVQAPARSSEYAINASNYRHWSAKVRAYVDDCVAGADGPREADCNMRWIASLVAECHRILIRGGIFLYPRDLRKGYENGRLRLVYEANPIAFLIEQAGGKAFDGQTRMLDVVPASLHQRVPLMFGSADEVDRLARYKSDPGLTVARAPLFHRRGLFKG